MDDIPEGLVEAVARAIAGHGIDPKHRDAFVDLRWSHYRDDARAAILAQNAWQDDLNRRMVEFVEFRGENPRGR